MGASGPKPHWHYNETGVPLNIDVRSRARSRSHANVGMEALVTWGVLEPFGLDLEPVD